MANRTPRRAVFYPEKTGQIREPRAAGMALANYSSTPSCGLIRGEGEFSDAIKGADIDDFRQHRAHARGWGGARNRRDRVSHNLTPRQVEGMIAAAEFSVSVKRPFQRHWTIHYERGGIDDRDGAAFVTRLLKLVGKAARRAGGEMTALWVRENGDGKGAHVHILLHLPEGMVLRGKTRRWLTLAGCAFRARVSHVRTIGRSVASAGAESANYRANIDPVLAYLVKGASAETGAALALVKSGEGGKIVGKRCGWTQNIGQHARKNSICEAKIG